VLTFDAPGAARHAGIGGGPGALRGRRHAEPLVSGASARAAPAAGVGLQSAGGSDMGPVVVFAHNEERRILAALTSIEQARPATASPFDIFVLINGSTDCTERLVEAYAAERTHVHPIVIGRGDKSNAWNHYIHDVAGAADVHFFMDGDVRVVPGSFDVLHDALVRAPDARAAAGVPMSGRNETGWRRHIVTNHGMPGCLYALRGELVAEMRRRGLRLPVGLIGEDVLLQWLVKHDLGDSPHEIKENIAPCPTAGFEFDSLSPWKLENWQVYAKRLRRNSLRYLQMRMIHNILKEKGVEGLPGDMEEIYDEQQLTALRPRRKWRERPIDVMTLRQLRAKARTRAAAGAAEVDERSAGGTGAVR
jgi:glycosyltransferase involved in cell wall biosynthesis